MASSSQQSGLKVATEGMSEEEITAAIEVSQVQGWSELRDDSRAGAAISCHADVNAAIWKELKRSNPDVFRDLREGELQLGQVIAEGGQSTIYEVMLDTHEEWDKTVAKVFKMEGFSLADLQRQWPQATKNPRKFRPFHGFRPFQLGGLLFGEVMDKSSDVHGFRSFQLGGLVFGEVMDNWSSILFGTILEDGRFAFVMPRFWGDLRTLINYRLNAKNFRGPPFSLDATSIDIMDGIGRGMRELHARGVLHRDLKAANIFISMRGDYVNGGIFLCKVADYESSMMVQGTGFWRAPEVLEDLQKEPSDRNAKIWTEKVDVYGYAMTCYEVLTGLVPFDGCTKSHWKKVIDGERPLFPDYVDPRLQRLVERCWHKNPSRRPTFKDIVYELNAVKSNLGDLETGARHASPNFFGKLRYKVNRLFRCSGSG